MARLAAREVTANKGFLFFNLTSIENLHRCFSYFSYFTGTVMYGKDLKMSHHFAVTFCNCFTVV